MKQIPFAIPCYPNGAEKTVTFSYDDGVVDDVRLAEIFRKHGLKATFNLNSGLMPERRPEEHGNRLSEAEAKAIYTPDLFEVAVHSCTHPRLEELPISRATAEVLDDKRRLEQLFGCIVSGMAYPYGAATTGKLVESLKSCGIHYARLSSSSESFDLPSDWLRLEPTCHHKNPRLMELAQQFVKQPAKGKLKMFYVWGHSYEFERKNQWEIMEELAAFVGHREDIWYATNDEIYTYVQSLRQMESSVDGSLLKNCSSQTLYVRVNQTVISLTPGETVRIA